MVLLVLLEDGGEFAGLRHELSAKVSVEYE